VTSIIVPTYDESVALFGRLFAALKRHTLEEHEVVVCDSGVEHLCAEIAHDARIIRLPLGATYVESINAGLAVARGETIVFCDTDSVVRGDGWLTECKDVLMADDAVGMVGDVWRLSGCAGFKEGYQDASLFDKRWWDAKRPNTCIQHVQGGFVVLRRSVVDQIGPMNRKFAISFADVEYSWRALSRGWNLASCGAVHSPCGAPRTLNPSGRHKVVHPVKDPKRWDEIYAEANDGRKPLE